MVEHHDADDRTPIKVVLSDNSEHLKMARESLAKGNRSDATFYALDSSIDGTFFDRGPLEQELIIQQTLALLAKHDAKRDRMIQRVERRRDHASGI